MGVSPGARRVVLRGRAKSRRDIGPPKARFKRNLRRAVVALLAGPLLLLMIAAGSTAILLHTEVGGRWALDRAVEWYNGSIPGRLSVGRFSGVLA